jgi:methylated-DNA-[protein]-cysteine S-methyltransferase
MSRVDTVANATLFPTSIGCCGIAWRGNDVIATHLPEASEEKTLARLNARSGGTKECDPPPSIQRAINAMTALLEGDRIDLAFIVCDLSSVAAFDVRVYDIARTIPPGETSTYGQIAARLGDKLLAQRVGQALGRNPLPIIVPCHRVVGATGKLTGFSANGGVTTKLRMLAIEGATIGQPASLFDNLPLAMKPGSPQPRRSKI